MTAQRDRGDRGYLDEHEVEGRTLAFDLKERLDSMLRGQSEGSSDRRGEALVKMGGLHIVLTALRRGARMSEHSARGPVAVQVLDGRVRLDVEGEQRELGPAHVGIVDAHVAHSLEALEDCALLITTAIQGPEGADIANVEAQQRVARESERTSMGGSSDAGLRSLD